MNGNYFVNLLIIAISSSLVSNVVLSQFLGLCPFLGVSKKVKTASGMGAAVIFVITLSYVLENNCVYSDYCGTCSVCGTLLKEICKAVI